MQVLKIGDVANSARNSRNAVCGMDDKFESIIRRHFRRGWEEVRGCWSKMITSYNYTKSLTTKSPRRTSIAATRSMVWQYFSVVCTNMYVVLCRLMRRSGTNQNPPPVELSQWAAAAKARLMRPGAENQANARDSIGSMIQRIKINKCSLPRNGRTHDTNE